MNRGNALVVAAIVGVALMTNSCQRERREPTAGPDVVTSEVGARPSAVGTEEQHEGGAELALCQDGETEYTICVAPSAAEVEHHAARELAHFLEMICGVPFRIDTSGALREPAIVVGRGSVLLSAAPDMAQIEFGGEELMIAARGKNLILTGGRPRGAAYAVYEFLDTRLGCRWFTKDAWRIPKRDTIRLRFSDYRFEPILEYREPFFTEAFDADWCLRNRMNSTHGRMGERHGGRVTYRGFVHTFHSLLPPDKYFEEHPEYYSEVFRRRLSQRAQLCLAHPDVVRIVTENVRAWARQKPSVDIISVSQNDCWGWCTCPKCSELVEKEGSQSGPIIHFVNQVADALKDEFPDLAIDTLAYSYSRKPPLHVRPRPNVIVRLCSIECCFSHALDDPDCAANVKFADDIRQWSRICKRLYIWDYVTDFAHYHAPFPNLRVLGPNIRFFVKHNVKGIFEEGAYPGGGGGESAELKSYIMARCLWKPETDDRQAMIEFLDCVYGPAAKPILEYYDALHDHVEQNDIHARIYMPPSLWFPPELVRRADGLFDQAEVAVRDDPVRSRRVRKARMWLKYVKVTAVEHVWKRKGDLIRQQTRPGYPELLDDYVADLREFGVRQIREGRPVEPWIESMKSRSRTKEYRVERLANDALNVEVIPGMGGRIHQMQLSADDGQKIMYGVEPGAEGYPLAGGYEEYIQRGYRSPGWSEEYKVLTRSSRSIVMTASLPGDFQVTRSYILDPSKPVLVVNTRIANASKETAKIAPRHHPAFLLGNASDLVVYKMLSDGSWQRLQLGALTQGKETEVYLKGSDMAAGKWILWNPKLELGVVNSFDPEKIHTQLINWHSENQRTNIELWDKEFELPSAGTIVLEHSYEIIRKLPEGAAP